MQTYKPGGISCYHYREQCEISIPLLDYLNFGFCLAVNGGVLSLTAFAPCMGYGSMLNTIYRDMMCRSNVNKDFRRTFEIPSETDIQTARSAYNIGILEITFKKKEQARSPQT